MAYLSWDKQIITDFSDESISDYYENGYLFTRIKSEMHQTRSARIDLNKFELSSENRRIWKKTEDIKTENPILLPYTKYEWSVGKMGKDFYESRGAEFSANKIKVMMIGKDKSDFNSLLVYSRDESPFGYVICYISKYILHYAYPFYSLDQNSKDLGLGMMLRAITMAREKGLRYVYLGSLQRPTDTYKLQFEGLEWFDGKKWSKDLVEVKEILK